MNVESQLNWRKIFVIVLGFSNFLTALLIAAYKELPATTASVVVASFVADVVCVILQWL